MTVLKTILVATDFSEYADAAFQVACSLAKDQGARLIVVHVNPPPATHAEVIDRREDPAYYETLQKQLAERKPADSGVVVQHQLRHGDPVEEIVGAAREHDCNLIVLGTHGRTGLRRLLMGSVAEKVLRSAPCPVLTINQPLTKPGPQ